MRRLLAAMILLGVPTGSARADETVTLDAPAEIADAWREALAVELAGSDLQLRTEDDPTYLVTLREEAGLQRVVVVVRASGHIVSTPTAWTDGRTLAVITVSLLIEASSGPSHRLTDPATPPIRPGVGLEGDEPLVPPPPPDPETFVYLDFDLGIGGVRDGFDSPWAVMTRVGLGYQLHPLLRLGVTIEGAMLAEAFAHNQPLIRACLAPALTVPLEDDLGLTGRVGPRGCLAGGRLRDGSTDSTTYGVSVGGHVALSLRVIRGLSLVLSADLDAWAPDALGGQLSAPRDWAFLGLGSLGVELRF